MIMPLKATETGRISHEMSPGSIIAAGDLLASLQLAVSGGIQCKFVSVEFLYTCRTWVVGVYHCRISL